MSKAKKAVNYVMLLSFLTALCGLLQTLWTTAPWWKKTESRPARIMSHYPSPKGGETALDIRPMSHAAKNGDHAWPWGMWALIVGGLVFLVILSGKDFVRMRTRAREHEQRMVL